MFLDMLINILNVKINGVNTIIGDIKIKIMHFLQKREYCPKKIE
jgi:hypothetical protein